MTADPAELRAAMIAAFPPRPITGAMIDEPTARWWDYERSDALEPQLEGRAWDELDPQFIHDHAMILIYAGNETYGALLPAYLMFCR